ncbi:MAG: hypothetical protein Q9214_001827 [Letrouitia sp. 1 TL-2023]
MSSRPFATIVPQGSDAERALDLVVDDPKLHHRHRSFISVQRATRPAESGSDLSESEKYNTPTEFWSGSYTLSLCNLPLNPTSVGWRIGRGSSKNPEKDRGVDLLLIRPRKKTEGVATVHARIQFHPLSGMFMLVGVEDEKPVEYKVHDSNRPIFLGQGQKHVLYQKTNSIPLEILTTHLSLNNSQERNSTHLLQIGIQYSRYLDTSLLTPHCRLYHVKKT